MLSPPIKCSVPRKHLPRQAQSHAGPQAWGAHPVSCALCLSRSVSDGFRGSGSSALLFWCHLQGQLMSSPRHQSPRLLGCLLTHSLLQKDGGRFCSRRESGPRPATGQPPPGCGFTGLSPGSAAPSTDVCFLPRRQLHFAFSSKNAHLDPLNPRTSESHRSALTCDFLPELGVTSAPSLASGAPSATQI